MATEKTLGQIAYEAFARSIMEEDHRQAWAQLADHFRISWEVVGDAVENEIERRSCAPVRDPDLRMTFEDDDH